ncbi:hypothetical protein C1752_00947 [Acaryochloris thomasi RCC1774]|uniref:Uncharacterized protein n=1 Tax=Acaryochloris thomasi RCC1774 TaxID=1764569 RepID=A0A2W1JNN4_9CYAN|nr:hypothetical protein [Acaryochloris thomasi]PZD74950.1 hypothetical protein C1752_00947 [Acaryochloris thomasi RCC1774]
MIVLATVGLRELMLSIQSGVLKGKHNFRTYRATAPGSFWYGICILGVVIFVMYYFGLCFLRSALMP